MCGRMLYARIKQCLTGEHTQQPGNAVVRKHVSMHASSEISDYIEKLQHIVYEQLTGGPFL